MIGNLWVSRKLPSGHTGEQDIEDDVDSLANLHFLSFDTTEM